MEEVVGVSGLLPSLPAYPPETIRSHIQPEQWRACLDVWLFGVEFRLRLAPTQFSNLKLSQNASGTPFLISYLESYENRTEPLKSGSSEAKLHHQCYFLLKRLLLTAPTPFDCTASILFKLISGGSVVFHSISDWKTTLRSVWKRNSAQIKGAVDAYKLTLVKGSTLSVKDTTTSLGHLKLLVRCLPEVAITTIAGVDFLETLMKAYMSGSHDVQEEATETVYYCLRSLMSDSQKHTSLLLDTLFEMKSEVDKLQTKHNDQRNLLSSLLCTTSFLRHLKSDTAVVTGKRGQGLVETLSHHRQYSAHLYPLPGSRQKSKGKQKINPTEELHMHKASKISQVHDLFPDLSNGYVLRLLDHFNDDVEACIAALLEPDSLPSSLQNQGVTNDTSLPAFDEQPDLAPRSTPPLLPQRKNVFDNDEFDRLQISSSRLHQGRREMGDMSQSTDQITRSKAAIMAALAAFDSDDDERDDTYDVADVGASVDNTVDSDERRGLASDKVEEMLFSAWKDSPELFARDSKTRITNTRQQLKRDTNMSDEQIEGWAIMMARDPKMAGRLETKYSAITTFSGQQKTLDRTSWNATAAASESQDEGNTSSDGRRIGQAGIRGVRQWNRGRGRGGGTAAPADAKDTQLARKRKEQGRGRGGATHNRREGRAKKMGRGMGPMANQ